MRVGSTALAASRVLPCIHDDAHGVWALTSNLHRASEPGNVLLDDGEGGLAKRSVVVVSQVSSVDKTRLGARIGSLSDERVGQILDGMRSQQASFFSDR